MTIFEELDHFLAAERINLPNTFTHDIVIMKATLFTDHVDLVLAGGSTKSISLQDFRDIVLSGIGNEVVSTTDNIVLPFGCVNVESGPKVKTLYCHYPEQKQEIIYHDRKITIPFPAMVIRFNLKEESPTSYLVQGINYSVYTGKVSQLPDRFPKNMPEKGSNFRQVPFPNFYDNGNMCFGGNQMPYKFTNNLRGLNYYYSVIFSSPFNDDLGVKGMKKSFNPKQLFEYLSTLDTFPYSELR